MSPATSVTIGLEVRGFLGLPPATPATPGLEVRELVFFTMPFRRVTTGLCKSTPRNVELAYHG